MVFTKGHKIWLGKNHSKKSREKMSRDHIGERNPAWKGGRRVREGRILILCKSHPHGDRDGYVYEHRLVMEKHIGRVLLPSENIHHINCDCADNRIENLMLLSKKEHSDLHRNKSGQFSKGGN